MSEIAHDGLLLHDELPSRLEAHGLHLLRDALVFPPDPPELTLDVVQSALNALPADAVEEIKNNAKKLYAFTMMQCDELGRPCKTTQSELVDILIHLNSFDWNKLLPRIQNIFNSGLSKNTDPIVEQLFNTYFSNRGQNIFIDRNEAWNIVLGKARTSNAENVKTLINYKLQQMDTIHRLGAFVPPSDPKDWLSVLRETIRLLNEGKIPEPERNFTPSELMSINMMMYEYVDGLRIGGNDMGTVLKPDIYGRDWYVRFDTDENITNEIFYAIGADSAYDPSVDVREKYRFCLKLLLRASKKSNNTSLTKETSPAERILLSMDNIKRDIEEFIPWVARGGSPPAPSFFFEDSENGEIATGVKNGDSREKNGRVYTYIENTADLRKPSDRIVRIFYTPHTKDIPAELTSDNWKKFISEGDLVELPLDDKQSFNTTMSALFGSPYTHVNMGAHTASAINKILSNSMDFLFSIPGTHDKGFEHLRKISVAHRRVGVYGQWTKVLDAQGTQIVFLTTHHKNQRRSDAAR